MFLGLFLGIDCAFFANFAAMKNTISLFILFLTLAMLASMLPGCSGRDSRYDSRLVAADSVLRSNDPDSALRLLTSIDARQLSTTGDRANHALLLTQAQYRCYVDIKSDSTINVALDYYKRHDGEQEKLTRCYIYKGAVTEVLDHPEEAMTYYKQAASIAAPDDHFNMGYAKMRIGSLYRDYLVTDSSDITLLNQALHHFRQVPDSFYVAQCLSTIGACFFGINQNDSALVYLERADTLIKAINATALDQRNKRYLADIKMFSRDVKDIAAAKDIAVSLADKETNQRNHLLLIAAFTLAKLNKADSANYYMKQVELEKLSDGLRVLHYRCLAELARCRGDLGQFQYYFEQADNIADSLSDNVMQFKLRDVEAKYDNEVLKNKSLRYRHNWMVSLLAVLLLAGASLWTFMTMRRRLKDRQRQVAENEETIERLRNETALLTSQLNTHQAMSNELKQAIRHQIEIFTQLVEKHAYQHVNSPKKFSEAFEQAYRKCEPDSTFWSSLRAYANSQYNNIIDQSIANCPELSDTDINYLILYCCDLPTSVIMACMGYREAHSSYNKKRRIAEALGSPDSLDAYVNLFKK